jgi:hypothetical protein
VQHPEKPRPIDTPMYYILKPAVDTEETGHVFPAVESYDGYDFNAPNSVHKLNFREFPGFVPDLRFKLAKGAKLCDMMGQATINAHGFLISERLKAVFEQFNIIPHRYYPAKVEDHKGNFHDYFWMHLVWEEGKDFVNYNDSVFFKRKFSNNLGYINLSSDKDFWDKKEELGSRYMIGIELLKFKVKPSFQLIVIPYKTDIVVDELMKNAISNYSGIDFQLIDYIQFTNPS